MSEVSEQRKGLSWILGLLLQGGIKGGTARPPEKGWRVQADRKKEKRTGENGESDEERGVREHHRSKKRKREAQ